ncbi:MAG: hypothetical protein R2761_31140 [Acidimicrobiales bacterium]
MAKHTIVGDKLEPRPDRSRCDPPVSFVNLLPQRETGSLTIGAKIRTNLHQVVVGLDYNNAGEITFKRPPSQLSSSSFQSAVPQFSHGHE